MIHISTAILAIEPNAIFTTEDNYLSSWDCDLKKPTEEEIKSKILELEAAEPMRLLRLERNRKLTDTDWVTLKAYSQGVEVPLTWKNYMQALRDLPATADPQLNENGMLTNVTWPEVPQ